MNIPSKIEMRRTQNLKLTSIIKINLFGNGII